MERTRSIGETTHACILLPYSHRLRHQPLGLLRSFVGGTFHVLGATIRCMRIYTTTVPSYGVGDGSKKAEYCIRSVRRSWNGEGQHEEVSQQGCSKQPSHGVNGGSKKPG